MPDAQCRLSATPGMLLEAEVDRGVAGDVAAALEALAHLEVVDVVRRDPGALERLAHRLLGQVEGRDVEQRALASRADRGTSRRDDDGVTHGRIPLENVGAEVP